MPSVWTLSRKQNKVQTKDPLNSSSQMWMKSWSKIKGEDKDKDKDKVKDKDIGKNAVEKTKQSADKRSAQLIFLASAVMKMKSGREAKTKTKTNTNININTKCRQKIRSTHLFSDCSDVDEVWVKYKAKGEDKDKDIHNFNSGSFF